MKKIATTQNIPVIVTVTRAQLKKALKELKVRGFKWPSAKRKLHDALVKGGVDVIISDKIITKYGETMAAAKIQLYNQGETTWGADESYFTKIRDFIMALGSYSYKNLENGNYTITFLLGPFTAMRYLLEIDEQYDGLLKSIARIQEATP